MEILASLILSLRAGFFKQLPCVLGVSREALIFTITGRERGERRREVFLGRRHGALDSFIEYQPTGNRDQSRSFPVFIKTIIVPGERTAWRETAGARNSRAQNRRER